MKKLGALILGAILTIGIGAGISVKPATDVAKAEETVVHTIDTTGTLQGSNNTYTSNCDVTVEGIKWNLEGNSKINPWRLGGKSSNTSAANRCVSTKTAFGDNISRIELLTGTTSKLTVNSLKLNVGTTNKASDVSSITATFKTNATIEFVRPSDADWSNCYFSFCFNLTATSTSNGYVQFKGAKFYSDGGVEDPTAITMVTVDKEFEVLPLGSELEATVKVTGGAEADTSVTWSTSDQEVATVVDGVVTPVAQGYATITATSNSNENKKASFVVAVTENAGTAANPFTVSDALVVADATGTSATIKSYYIEGTVKSVKEISTSYGNATLTLTDGEKTFDCYRMNDVDGSEFTDAKKIVVGDILTVKGSIIKYSGTTPQLNQYGELVTIEYTAASVATRIKTLAGGWENEVATANCYANYEKVNEMILALSAEELNTFKTSDDEDIASARTTYEYWCFANGATPYSETVTAGLRLNVLNDTNSVLVIVSIIALVTMLGAVTMLVIRKKKIF